MSEAAEPARTGGMRSDLMVRTISGVAMVAVAVVSLVLGSTVFWALVATIAFAMLIEWGGLVGASRVQLAVALAFFLLPLAMMEPHWTGPDRDAVAVTVAAGLAVIVLTGRPRLGGGLLYIGLAADGLLYLRSTPGGADITFWTMAVVWSTDIGAYFAGRRLGGPKLAPRLSPKKTWAGLGGGVLAALIAGALIAAIGGLGPAFYWLGAPMAVIAQGGDLYESHMKRRAGVKDSGRLLPGHGGLFDRMDGLVPVAALVGMLLAGGWL